MMIIPREEKCRSLRRVTSQPLWSLDGGVRHRCATTNGLRCADTAALDIELGSASSAANVTMSTTGRVWHYSRGERCAKCSVHEKTLIYEPAVASHLRLARKNTKPRMYYYVGASLNDRRHGWGRLMDEKRLLCEGQHDLGVVRGFYLIYHEYSVELGALFPWGRVGAFLLADRESSIAPFAYGGAEGAADAPQLDPYVRVQRSKQGALLEVLGESVCAVSRVAPVTRRTKQLGDDQPNVSKSLDLHYLCPTRRWRREGSGARRLVGRSDADTIDTTKFSSSDSLPPPPPPLSFRRRRSSGNRSAEIRSVGEAASQADCEVGEAATPFREGAERRSLGERSSGERQRRPSLASDSDGAMLAECMSTDDLGPANFTRSASSSHSGAFCDFEGSCVCATMLGGSPRRRRNSWPRVGQHGEMRWARRAFEASPLSPLRKQTWECPERTDFQEHRWRVTAFDALAGKRLQGLTSWAWSSEDLGRFLAAIGLPELAYHFVHQGITGFDLKLITTERLLAEFGVSGPTAAFVLCALRTLIAATDETDLLFPLHGAAKPRDCEVLTAEDFALRRRLGVGGHAVVYHATRQRNRCGSTADVAVKCFPHTRRKKRVSIEQPPASTRRTLSNNLSSRVADTLSSFRQWMRGGSKAAEMPTIILSKAHEEAPELRPQRRSAFVDHLVSSRSSGERARDKELLVLQSLPLHRNIIQCFGQIGGTITGIVLEFCHKGAIHDSILPGGAGGPGANQNLLHESLSRRQIVKYFEDIAAGLTLLHSVGYVHRDLKPSNFLVSADGCAKLSDFGMATGYRNVNPVYLGSYGNIFYAAPEVLLGAGFWPASDIFSLGVSFWESLTRSGSYGGLTKGEIFCTVCSDDYMRLFAMDHLQCPELATLISQMLQFDHTQRPTAAQVTQTLSSLLSSNHALALSRVQRLFDI